MKIDLCPKYSLNNHWKEGIDYHQMIISTMLKVGNACYVKESRRDWSRFGKIDKLEVRTVGSHYITKFDQSLCHRETELAIFYYISDHFILDLRLITFGWKEYFKDINQSLLWDLLNNQKIYQSFNIGYSTKMTWKQSNSIFWRDLTENNVQQKAIQRL